MNKITLANEKAARNFIEQAGQRVLTTAQLAESYETDNKMISNNFARNKERYKEGKHFFLLEGEALKRFKITNPQFDESSRFNKLYLWTEKGACLHAKSINTDKLWVDYSYINSLKRMAFYQQSKNNKLII